MQLTRDSNAVHFIRSWEPGRVRMIHHGLASRSRRIELMIEVLRHTDERFRLENEGGPPRFGRAR